MDNFNAHKWFKNQYLKESDDPKIGAELEAGMFGTGVAEGEEGINKIDNKQIGVEFSDKFDVKAFSSGDTLDIRTKEDIDNSTFENMIKFIEDKGYTVNKEQSRSDFEHEPGERYYYPRIKFSK